MKTQKMIQKDIEKIKAKLFAIGDMHPGSLSMQYNVCGKKGCRCKDPEAPKKHGPYHQLSYVHNGKSTSRFIAAHYVPEVNNQIENYKLFKMLMQEWADEATTLAQMRAAEAKAAGKK
jgi:hypothetical protein